MDFVNYDPLEAYEKQYRELHRENTRRYFDDLTARSQICIDENRETVERYHASDAQLRRLRRKRNWFLAGWTAVMCLVAALLSWYFGNSENLASLLTISGVCMICVAVIVVAKQGNAIKHVRTQTADLLEQARKQVQPLMDLLTDDDVFRIISETIPLLSFSPSFSAQAEQNLIVNYDDCYSSQENGSALEVLHGTYNTNPFLFVKEQCMGLQTENYYGFKRISWKETYTDLQGKKHTQRKYELLMATRESQKPYYFTKTALRYGAQSAPNLSFSRKASHVEQKSERAVAWKIWLGKKRLTKKTNRALRKGNDYVMMSNPEFEVLFNAMDRDHDQQFRLLFTDLAQQNMQKLLRSKEYYGDDFGFQKKKRMNCITSKHSQGRPLWIRVRDYESYSFAQIQEKFLQKNQTYFEQMYFDFAPLWAIPLYREDVYGQWKPIAEMDRQYSFREYEALAAALPKKTIVHPDTKIDGAIFNVKFLYSEDGTDCVCITAHSYDCVKRTSHERMRGQDGKDHDVAVRWKEYLPLERSGTFYVGTPEAAAGARILAEQNGLCIFLEK